ncbi:MAG: argininosuccinate lyase, partial [Gemmatimonadetes bacterium]|nr:argininosuccinate lyase [Gemmatimonadota bacterium]
FGTATAQLMERFNASIGFDRRLMEVDIAGSCVYARALARAGLLTEQESARIIDGLGQVQHEMSDPAYDFADRLEDIHMAVETRLTELVGPVGGKLHTGRSRNDQVNLDERLYLKAAIASIAARIRTLQRVLVDFATHHTETILPGYTHLQQAQPILLAHYALSLFWALERDAGRLADTAARADAMPLGSGALAGSAFPLDRDFMARELGFSRVTPNSLDAVSDRDYFIEALGALSMTMIHLSRYCEDLILWSSAEFGFVELDDAYSTGSSMMPQKKNPDSLELVRGKSGRVVGGLVSLLMAMKGLGLTYGKDLQEDKEPVFDAFDTVTDCLEVFTAAWATMTVHGQRMEEAIDAGALATDLADYLVDRGVPFREAHHVIGDLVRATIASGGTLTGLSHADLHAHDERFGPDAVDCLNLRASLERRNLPGGTGPASVAVQLEQAAAILVAVEAMPAAAEAMPAAAEARQDATGGGSDE